MNLLLLFLYAFGQFSYIFLGMRLGFPGGSEGKASACDAKDPGSIPALGRSPGEGNGNSLQYSCLDNPVDRGAWQATARGVEKVGHDRAINSFILFTLPMRNASPGMFSKTETHIHLSCFCKPSSPILHTCAPAWAPFPLPCPHHQPLPAF